MAAKIRITKSKTDSTESKSKFSRKNSDKKSDFETAVSSKISEDSAIPEWWKKINKCFGSVYSGKKTDDKNETSTKSRFDEKVVNSRDFSEENAFEANIFNRDIK